MLVFVSNYFPNTIDTRLNNIYSSSQQRIVALYNAVKYINKILLGYSYGFLFFNSSDVAE